MTTFRANATGVLLGSLLVLGLAGCSSGAGQPDHVASLNGTTTSTPAAGGSGHKPDAAQHDALVKYAQCMRAHGINMPDPLPGGALNVPAANTGDPAARQKLQTAHTACASDLPNGGTRSDADLQRGVKLAQCMRAHGVNMPDPTNGASSLSINLSDPATKAALTACAPAAANAGGSSSGR